MNKMLKLPLFLGVCGTVCAGLLAGVYALTNPIVQKAKAEKANAAYISMYSEFGVVGTDVTTEEVDNIAGCSLRAIIVNANVKVLLIHVKLVVMVELFHSKLLLQMENILLILTLAIVKLMAMVK